MGKWLFFGGRLILTNWVRENVNYNVISVILMWFMSGTMKKIRGVMQKEHIPPSLM